MRLGRERRSDEVVDDLLILLSAEQDAIGVLYRSARPANLLVVVDYSRCSCLLALGRALQDPIALADSIDDSVVPGIGLT
jgi:hypothetical protein